MVREKVKHWTVLPPRLPRNLTLCFLGAGHCKSDTFRQEPCICVRTSWSGNAGNKVFANAEISRPSVSNTNNYCSHKRHLRIMPYLFLTRRHYFPRIDDNQCQTSGKASSSDIQRSKLSQETDRVPALSGIAVRASSFLGNTSVVSGFILSSTISYGEPLC